jgi:hypothetical protein
MSETFAKRARAKFKQMKQKDKAERRKTRREQPAPPPTPEAIEAAYFFDSTSRPPVDPPSRD